MSQFISLEFLVAVLFIIDVVVILLLILFVRRVNRIPGIQAEQKARDIESMAAAASDAGAAAAAEAAGEVRQILLPLVEASREAAQEFDELIREKKKITKALNDALDSKIISLNLLLSRADALEKKLETHQSRIIPPQAAPPVAPHTVQTTAHPTVMDQQNRIIDLYYQQVDIDTIAEQLSIPKGEVRLVIDLKEKFLAMENA